MCQTSLVYWLSWSLWVSTVRHTHAQTHAFLFASCGLVPFKSLLCFTLATKHLWCLDGFRPQNSMVGFKKRSVVFGHVYSPKWCLQVLEVTGDAWYQAGCEFWHFEGSSECVPPTRPQPLPPFASSPFALHYLLRHLFKSCCLFTYQRWIHLMSFFHLWYKTAIKAFFKFPFLSFSFPFFVSRITYFIRELFL